MPLNACQCEGSRKEYSYSPHVMTIDSAVDLSL